MDAFARWLTRHPLAVVVANLAVTAVLGLYAVHIRIENSLESMLPAGDPKVAYYNTTRALFGSDDVGVIGVRADDVFAPSTILKIARVTDALDLQDGRGGEHVVGADADHSHVVAPEERPGGVVVRDLGVARGQHALE